MLNILINMNISILLSSALHMFPNQQSEIRLDQQKIVINGLNWSFGMN